MPTPRFSIVIPTRERSRTLEFALQTCLRQSFDDFEVIVCDNCSTPLTREVVERLRDDKIKYVRSDTLLAMSSNWELAVSHAAGQYITVLGDDDGLLFHALAEADTLIRQLGVQVLRWPWLYYSWPDQASSCPANRLYVPLPTDSVIVSSKDQIQRVIRGDAHYASLPMLYNSFIHRDLIAELRRSNKRVFNCSIPDIYSGFAFAALAESYASVGRAMGIAGVSGKSNGEAVLHGRSDNAISQSFETLNAAAELRWSSNVPQVPQSLTATMAHAFECARESVFPNRTDLQIDRRWLAQTILSEIGCRRNLTESVWTAAVAAIASGLSRDIQSWQWFDQYQKEVRPSFGTNTKAEQSWNWGFTGSAFEINAAEFGVSNVMQVSELFEKLFYCKQNPRRTQDVHRFKTTHANASLVASVKNLLRDVTPPFAWRIASKAARVRARDGTR